MHLSRVSHRDTFAIDGVFGGAKRPSEIGTTSFTTYHHVQGGNQRCIFLPHVDGRPLTARPTATGEKRRASVNHFARPRVGANVRWHVAQVEMPVVREGDVATARSCR